MINKLILLYLFKISNSYILPQTFKNWHCINFDKNIDKSKPFSYNIGNLPLITWFDQNNLTKSYTTINICKHMGSKLDNSNILNDCLICPYHNIKYTSNDIYGETILYQNKLWWSFKPYNKLPPNIPLYNNNNFESVLLQRDMDANIIDCMMNILDINYHKILIYNIFNIKLNINNLTIINKISIKFKLNNININYIFKYPYTSYYIININKHKIIININLLPLNNNKTRWYINIRYNIMKSFVTNIIINLITKIILNYNEKQLFNIVEQSLFKNYITYNFNQYNISDNNYNIKYTNFMYNIKQKYNNYLFPDKYCIEHFIKNIKFY